MRRDYDNNIQSNIHEHQRRACDTTKRNSLHSILRDLCFYFAHIFTNYYCVWMIQMFIACCPAHICKRKFLQPSMRHHHNHSFRSANCTINKEDHMYIVKFLQNILPFDKTNFMIRNFSIVFNWMIILFRDKFGFNVYIISVKRKYNRRFLNLVIHIRFNRTH